MTRPGRPRAGAIADRSVSDLHHVVRALRQRGPCRCRTCPSKRVAQPLDRVDRPLEAVDQPGPRLAELVVERRCPARPSGDEARRDAARASGGPSPIRRRRATRRVEDVVAGPPRSARWSSCVDLALDRLDEPVSSRRCTASTIADEEVATASRAPSRVSPSTPSRKRSRRRDRPIVDGRPPIRGPPRGRSRAGPVDGRVLAVVASGASIVWSDRWMCSGYWVSVARVRPRAQASRPGTRRDRRSLRARAELVRLGAVVDIDPQELVGAARPATASRDGSTSWSWPSASNSRARTVSARVPGGPRPATAVAAVASSK